MSNNINYFDIEIPENKKSEEFTFAERRAELLRLILEAGHPRAINQSKLCKRYGVSQGQISKDMKALSKHLREQSTDDIKFIAETVFHNSIKKLQKKEQYFKAAKVNEMWLNWLFNTGRIEKAAEKINVNSITSKDFQEAYDEFKTSNKE